MENFLLEAMDAIKKINAKISTYGEYSEFISEDQGEYISYLGISATDTIYKIIYLGFNIWRSDEDDRDIIIKETKSGDPVYEPIYNYLTRKVKLINEIIGSIKL